MVGTGNFLNVEIPKETQKITLALDNDDAGNNVAERSTQRFAPMYFCFKNRFCKLIPANYW